MSINLNSLYLPYLFLTTSPISSHNNHDNRVLKFQLSSNPPLSKYKYWQTRKVRFFQFSPFSFWSNLDPWILIVDNKVVISQYQGDGGASEALREQDRLLPIANVGRIMKNILPANAKIAKDAKETLQECVSEFISFITSEGTIIDRGSRISKLQSVFSQWQMFVGETQDDQRRGYHCSNGNLGLWKLLSNHANLPPKI